MNPVVTLISYAVKLRKLKDSDEVFELFNKLVTLFLQEEDWTPLKKFFKDNQFIFNPSIKDHLEAAFIALRNIVLQTTDKEEIQKLATAVSNSHSGVVALKRFEQEKVFRGIHRKIIIPDGGCKACFSNSTEHRYSTQYPQFKEDCSKCTLISLGNCPEASCPCKGEGVIYDASMTAGKGYYGVHFHKYKGKPVFIPVQRRAVLVHRVNQKLRNIYLKE